MIEVLAIALLIGFAGAIYIAAPIAKGGARVIGLLVAGGITLGAILAYMVNGEPETPGQPYDVLVERLRNTDPTQLRPIEQEERLRDAIRRDPTDVRALALLGRFLARTDRELEAITIFGRALRQGEDARLLSDLGEALVNLNEGQVTDRARATFAQAYALDPNLPEPPFFLGSAAYVEGDRITATRYWSDIIGRLPADDPYRQAIASRAADMLSRPMGGPGASGEVPFAEGAEDTDVDAMVSSMVARLESRLAEEPGDLSGWLTLARARMMLDQPELARDALDTARVRFGAERGKLALVEALEAAFEFEESDA
jgi:cytochrome c-type biogenesis protein CcmH